jgi:hypothetical protein
MNRRTFTKFFGGAVALPGTKLFDSAVALSPRALSGMQAPAAAPASTYRSASPFDAGTRAQLFVDRVIVRDSPGVAFTLHPGRKHPKNPLVKADRPWEGWRLEIYGNVLHDDEERIYKMWYLGDAKGAFRDGSYPTCYAVSSDGVAWEKPLVGTIASDKYEKHNAVAMVDLACVIKDQADSNPARRYKMITFVDSPRASRGYQTFASPDGLHWTRSSTAPICRSGDVITGYYDEGRKLYVGFPKIGTPIRGHHRRVFYTITSPDFERWSEPKLALYPDLADDAGSLARIEEARYLLDRPDDPALMRTEFYGMGFYPHESCTLGFPWVFTINNNARYGNHEGPFELQLAVSRDLENWERPFRVPAVPRGRRGEWDEGLFVTQSRALRAGDEIRLYYGGSNYTHGTPCLYRDEGTGRLTKYTGSIGLVTWKLDRFVSADAGGEGGTLTTVPLAAAGSRLELNFETRRGGKITVEALDAGGRPIEGFGASDPVHGDELRKTVTWRGNRDVSKLVGKPLVLRFQLKDASLYSFAFRA